VENTNIIKTHTLTQRLQALIDKQLFTASQKKLLGIPSLFEIQITDQKQDIME